MLSTKMDKNAAQPRSPNGPAEALRENDTTAEARHERWAHCHVNWTAVFLGTLTTFGMLLLFGLAGVALGAHLLGPENRIVDVKQIGVWTMALSVCAAFFSAAAGGWVAARIAGILHAEPAMLHGAFVSLVTVPMLVAASALGASGLLGGWYAGLGTNAAPGNTTPFVRPDPVGTSATAEEAASFRDRQADYERNVRQWREDTPKAVRAGALVAITSFLIGLLGSVIGGWMGSGEPMNFTHYRSRKPRYHVG